MALEYYKVTKNNPLKDSQVTQLKTRKYLQTQYSSQFLSQTKICKPPKLFLRRKKEENEHQAYSGLPWGGIIKQLSSLQGCLAVGSSTVSETGEWRQFVRFTGTHANL